MIAVIRAQPIRQLVVRHRARQACGSALLPGEFSTAATTSVPFALMRTLGNFIRFGAIAVAVAVTLSGCSARGTGESSRESGTPEAAWNRAGPPPDPHTLLRAGDLAVSQVPDSVLIAIENQTQESGTWRVQVVTPDGAEHQLTIGSDAVAVLVAPTVIEGTNADKAKRRANVEGTRVDFRGAVDRVLRAVPNSSITELDLLDMNGTLVWQADVWDDQLAEHDVTVDAVTGMLATNAKL